MPLPVQVRDRQGRRYTQRGKKRATIHSVLWPFLIFGDYCSFSLFCERKKKSSWKPAVAERNEERWQPITWQAWNPFPPPSSPQTWWMSCCCCALCSYMPDCPFQKKKGRGWWCNSYVISICMVWKSLLNCKTAMTSFLEQLPFRRWFIFHDLFVINVFMTSLEEKGKRIVE